MRTEIKRLLLELLPQFQSANAQLQLEHEKLTNQVEDLEVNLKKSLASNETLSSSNAVCSS